MTFVLLPAQSIGRIHDAVLNPGELQGLAGDKSLDCALARVENRLIYGMIGDVFDLAAAYCVAVATEQVFNDVIKRRIHQVMHVCLDLDGVQLAHVTVEAGELTRKLAQGYLSEEHLSAWLGQNATC